MFHVIPSEQFQRHLHIEFTMNISLYQILLCIASWSGSASTFKHGYQFLDEGAMVLVHKNPNESSFFQTSIKMMINYLVYYFILLVN